MELRADIDYAHSYQWWELRMAVDVVDGQTLVNALLLNIDEQKQQEQHIHRLKAAAEDSLQQENFLIHVSHEIRTPMNIIIGFCDMLAQMAPSDISTDEMREMSTAVDNNCQALKNLIDDIVTFSLVSTVTIEYHPKDIQVDDFMLAQQGIWTNQVKKEQEFVFQPGHQHLTVYADPQRLADVLRFYMLNAIKFSKQGRIILGWQILFTTNQVEFYVEDSGIGISQANHDLVGRMFWKADLFVSGMGISLHLAKHHAQAMGGIADFQSQTGLGSRFTLTLPLK